MGRSFLKGGCMKSMQAVSLPPNELQVKKGLVFMWVTPFLNVTKETR